LISEDLLTTMRSFPRGSVPVGLVSRFCYYEDVSLHLNYPIFFGGGQCLTLLCQVSNQILKGHIPSSVRP
jgi:hypothetical protein